jgi:C-3',4' desaturase CrtD
MSYEVVVVGAGFGGLTAAALLAARGVKVCLLEKQSSAGGVAVGFEKFGYRFEVASLLASWGPGQIHERVFAELPVAAPTAERLSPSYVLRLPDHANVVFPDNLQDFEDTLRVAFPECSDAAIGFYRGIALISEALNRVARRAPDLLTASRFRRMRAMAPEAAIASRVLKAANDTTAKHLPNVSARFRRFIDAQLQIFGQCDSEQCSYLYAAVVLMLPFHGLYRVRGGAAAIAAKLVESIKQSGGEVRFDTSALRLAYDSNGNAIGVDLLSEERVEATRAIVSNLTVWDTYGKLVGLNRTPNEIRTRLKSVQGWGAYLLYLGMDEATATKLPGENILAVTDLQETTGFDPENAQFMFAASPSADDSAPDGMRAVTVSTFTEPTQWFSFHESEEEHEEIDKQMLETWWSRIHAAMPELADGIEVIETATPRTFYEDTRRKLGMVGGVGQSLNVFGPNSFSHRTSLPNLFMVGDTTFPGNGIAGVTQSGLIVADEIAPR